VGDPTLDTLHPVLDRGSQLACANRPVQNEAEIDGRALDVVDRRVRLYVESGARPLNRPVEVDGVGAGGRDDQVRMQSDDGLDVHGTARQCDRGGVSVPELNSRRCADEPGPSAQPVDELRCARVERDDARWTLLHRDERAAGAVHLDRVLLGQRAERLRPLAAGGDHERKGGERERKQTWRHQIMDYHEMRLFTPEEANEALATVRPLAERLVAARRAFVGVEQELTTIRVSVAGNGGKIDPRRAATLQARAARTARDTGEAVQAIEKAGAQVKDVDEGLVDFPARHPADGSDVLLCWRLGEEEVAFWHGLEEGFAGRKPLPF